MLHFFEQNDVSIHLQSLMLIEKTSSAIHEEIELYHHEVLGRILIINNEIQHIEAWAPLYHECLVHLPSAFIQEIKNVLIIGGGSFYAAAEVLKYQSLEKLTMVDYDSEVTKLTTKHYEHAQIVRIHPKFNLVTEDISLFLMNCAEKYDLVINDALDLLNNDQSWFDLLADRLTAEGVCSDVIFRHIFEKEKSLKTIRALQYRYTSAYSLITVPEYPGILHLLSMWGKTESLNQNSKNSINNLHKKWMEKGNSPFVFFDPRFLSYYLHLPPYLKKAIHLFH